jgi:hypothetical protein
VTAETETRLRALIEAVLAFDHPDFPSIGVDQVLDRMRAQFPLDGAELGAGLRALDDDCAREHDLPGGFRAAPLAARRATLRGWARSEHPERRRLYASLKALVLLPAYSLPELWRAIGYEGPARGR